MTLQTSCQTSFFLWKTNQHNLLKTFLIFLLCHQNILYKFHSMYLAFFSSKKYNRSGNFEAPQQRYVVLHFGHLCAGCLATGKVRGIKLVQEKSGRGNARLGELRVATPQQDFDVLHIFTGLWHCSPAILFHSLQQVFSPENRAPTHPSHYFAVSYVYFGVSFDLESKVKENKRIMLGSRKIQGLGKTWQVREKGKEILPDTLIYLYIYL